MCQRYDNQLSWSEVRELLTLIRPEPGDAPVLQPQGDISPISQQWVIRRAEDGVEAVQMRWGLVPWFHKGRALSCWKATTCSAPADSVKYATAYKRPFARRRCLVPASGWSEWAGRTDFGQRWAFTAKDGAPLTFAGIWDCCQTSDCGLVESFAIVTQALEVAPNALHLHAPVVIWAMDRERWLTPGTRINDLIGPQSVDRFEVRPAI